MTAITGKKLTGWLPGFHLSDDGLHEAKSVADRLAGLRISAVYASPLERCQETAQPIASKLGLRVRTAKDVGEVRYGDWEGRSFKSLYKMKAWRELNARRADFRFPGGETPREAQTRAVAAIERLKAEHDDEAVVVVSHADLIKLIVSGYLGLPLDLYHRLTVKPASVTPMYLRGSTPSLLGLNYTGDLEWVNDYLGPSRRRAKKR